MDNYNELERIESEISSIEEAIVYLQDVRHMEDVIADLNDRMIVLKTVGDFVRRRIEAQDARDEAELTSEYYKSVL